MQQNQNKINIIIHAKNNNDPKIDKVKIKSTVNEIRIELNMLFSKKKIVKQIKNVKIKNEIN